MSDFSPVDVHGVVVFQIIAQSRSRSLLGADSQPVQHTFLILAGEFQNLFNRVQNQDIGLGMQDYGITVGQVDLAPKN